ncbi:MAG: hypothetical protein ACXVC0_20120, partial [Bdellovibrionota bacterium]
MRDILRILNPWQSLIDLPIVRMDLQSFRRKYLELVLLQISFVPVFLLSAKLAEDGRVIQQINLQVVFASWVLVCHAIFFHRLNA